MKKRIFPLFLCVILLLCSCDFTDQTTPRTDHASLNLTENVWNASFAAEPNRVSVSQTENGLTVQNSMLSAQFTEDGGFRSIYMTEGGDLLLQDMLDVTLQSGEQLYAAQDGATPYIHADGPWYSSVCADGILLQTAATEGTQTRTDYWSFARASNVESFSALTKNVTVSQEAESLKFVVTDAGDAYFGATDATAKLDGANIFTVTLKGSGFTKLGINFAANGKGFSDETTEIFDIVPTSEYQTFTFVITNPNWRGSLKSLRFMIYGAEKGAWGQLERIDIYTVAAETFPATVSHRLHMYADRQYLETDIRLNDAAAVDAVTTELRIPRTLCVAGEIRSDGAFWPFGAAFDPTETEYIGFRLKTGLVLGVIAPSSAFLERMELIEDPSVYRIRFTWLTSSLQGSGTALRTGFRLYCSYDDDFMALRAVADAEHAPFSTAELQLSGAMYAGYDPFLGAYRYSATETVTVSAIGRESAQKLYFFGTTPNLDLYDENGFRLPIAVQSGKYDGTSYTVFPLTVPAETKLVASLRMTTAVPHLETSSDGQMRLRFSDTLAVDPLLSDGHFITEHRTENRSGVLTELLSLTDTYRKEQPLRLQAILFGDLDTVTLRYRSADGTLDVELVCARENGALDVQTVCTFRKAVMFSSLKDDIRFFRSYASNEHFGRYSFYDAADQVEKKIAEADSAMPLMQNTPFYTLYNMEDNASLIGQICSFSMTVGGQQQEKTLLLHYSDKTDGKKINNVSLSVDAGQTSFLAGDRIVLHVRLRSSDAEDVNTEALTYRESYLRETAHVYPIGTVFTLDMETTVLLTDVTDYRFPPFTQNGVSYTPSAYDVYVQDGFCHFAVTLPAGLYQ